MRTLPEAIFFDADNTLYNSLYLLFESYQRAFSELYGLDLSWDQYKNEVLEGLKNGPTLLHERGFKAKEEEFYEVRDRVYEELVCQKLQPMPGVVNFLEWCQEEGIKCAVVSSSRKHLLDLSLTTLGIKHHFPITISYEDVNGRHKPDPFPYNLALRKVNTPLHRAIAVEDSLHGIASAKAAGLECIGLLHERNNRIELRQADLTVLDYDQIISYLTSH